MIDLFYPGCIVKINEDFPDHRYRSMLGTITEYDDLDDKGVYRFFKVFTENFAFVWVKSSNIDLV